MPRRAAQARGALRQDRGQEHLRSRRAVGAQSRRMVHATAERPQRQAERNRRARAQGNPRAAEIFGRRRPRLSDAGPRLRHIVRRREPAHPAGLADRLRPHRRTLRPRRALDRPAPARQCAPAGNTQAASRPRQHRDRGRARRGRHPHRRPCARHRPRRRHPRRPHHRRRQRRRHYRRAQFMDRQISRRRIERADPRAQSRARAAR